MMAWHIDPDQLRSLLGRNAVSYQIESQGDLMRFVAFLDKPLAELLDDMKVPRERYAFEFIEFHGPLPYNPHRLVVRRVTPGLISQPRGFTVQPMVDHIAHLPILAPMRLSSPEAWNEVTKIVAKLAREQLQN
jgi:hypothetical protein